MRELVGVILAAGEGQRMGEISAHYAKPVLPICSVPLIATHLKMLEGINIKRAVVVVGHQRDKVVQTAKAHCPKGLKLHFVDQTERLGIAHALNETRDLTDGCNLVVILGDTHFIPTDLDLGLKRLSSGEEDSVAGVLSVRRVQAPEMIRRECTVRFDFTGSLVEIQEKPVQPFNELKPCGIYFFSPAIFEAIEMTLPSALRGEVEITDSIQTLVELGYTVTGAPTVEWDRNINYPGDLLISNLVELKRRELGSLIGPRTTFHEDAEVRDSVVGKDVQILSPAKLLRSLVLDGAVVEEHGDFIDCVIGPRFAIPDCLKYEWADTPEAFSL